MVQFTHLRIAHTKISFYFGNPKSRGKICGVRQNAGRMQQRKTGDSRHTTGCGGVRRKTAFGSRHKKERKAATFLSFGEPAGVATISYNWLISSILSVWLCGSVMIWTLVDVAACLIFVRQILRFKGNEFLCNKKLFGCVL